MRKLIGYISFLAVFLGCFANTLRASGLSDSSNEYVILHTDRDLYLSGESLLFSAEVLNRSHGKEYSKVLYMDLFSNEVNKVWSGKYDVIDRSSSGVIEIPEHLSTGYYILRVYTRYQNNFPSWLLTTKVIRVVNAKVPLMSVKAGSNFEFAVLNDGRLGIYWNLLKNENVSRVKLSRNGEIVDSAFKLFENGLAYSHSVVDKGDYSIGVTLKDGKSSAKNFNIDDTPAFMVRYNNNYHRLEIVPCYDFSAKSTLKIKLKNIHTQKTIDKTVMVYDKANLELSKEIMDEGLCYLSVSDTSSGNNLYTFIYINKVNDIDSSISVKKSNGKISVASKDQLFSASMIINGSFYDDELLLPDYLVFNPLYLTPNNYVDIQGDIALALGSKSLLDYIDAYVNKNEPSRPEFFGPTIQGKLNNLGKGEEVVFCSLLGDNPQFHAVNTYDSGRFDIDLQHVNRVSDLYLVSKSLDSLATEPEIYSGFNLDMPFWNPTAFVPDSNDRELLTRMLVNMQVGNLTGSNKPECINPASCDLPLFGSNLTRIRTKDFIQLDNTRELFNEIVSFVKVRKHGEKAVFVVLDDNTGLQYNDPLVLFNNIYYPNIEAVISLQPTEIEKVEVINHRYVYGDFIFNGIISITSTSDNFIGIPMTKSGVFFSYESPAIPVMPLVRDYTNSDMFSNTYYWAGNVNELELTIPEESKGNYKLVINNGFAKSLVIDL